MDDRALYNDNYPTCIETYATIRVSSAQHDCAALQARLQLSDATCRISPRAGSPRAVWGLSSEAHVRSRDTRRHIDWLLDRIEPAPSALLELREEGATADIFCYFVSVGHGGPMLSPQQMTRLAALDLTVGWDVYCSEGEVDDPSWSKTPETHL